MDVSIEILEAIDMSLESFDKHKHEDSTLLESISEMAYKVAEFVAYGALMIGVFTAAALALGMAGIWLALKTLEFLVIQFPL